MSYHRKPPIATHLVDKARGASFMQVYQGLGLKLKRVNATELAGPCPRCGGDDRFSLNTKLEVWNCRGCVKGGGDALSLLMHVRGLEFRDAVTDLNGESADDARQAPAPIEAKAKPANDDAARDAFIRRMVEKTLRGIVPIIGTQGEAYLRDVRKIDTGKLVDVLSVTDAIGWHPTVYFNEPGHPLHGRNLDAIIGVMSDPVTAMPTGAISRTYIGPDGNKVGKAKTLASPMGIVRLSADDEVLQGLCLSEGLESALAGMSLDLRPMWSTGSTALMAKFPVLPAIEELNIFCDHDANGAGEKAAREAEARWRAAGREVNLYQTGELGDLNTLLKGC